MASTLDDTAVARALEELPDWTGDAKALRRTAELPEFLAAVAVVVDIARVAEEMDHHPDIDIRYRTLTFTCATHSAGGVTDSDLELARQIDGVVARHVQG